MPGNPHPVDQWLDDRNAVDGKAYAKLHDRVVVADADEVRNTDFSAQYGGVNVRSIGANYNLDADDLGTDDLSDTSDIIIDAAGNHFVRSTDTSAETQRVVTAAGTVTVSADDVDIIIIQKTVGAATTVNLPSAADRTRAVEIVDGKGDAATNNITIVPQSGETIFATVDYHAIIDANGASLRLRPRSDDTGWI
jgi:hypothetical protein